MKTIVKLLLCMALFTLPYIGCAQYLYSGPSDMDINGVFEGGKYTKAQVVAKWGTPTKYESQESEFGLNEFYEYSNNRFSFSDNGIFVEFYVDSPNFVVYTSFSGGIKVGDPISRIEEIGLGTPTLTPQNHWRHGTYGLNRNNSDDTLYFGHSNGVITYITFITYL